MVGLARKPSQPSPMQRNKPQHGPACGRRFLAALVLAPRRCVRSLRGRPSGRPLRFVVPPLVAHALSGGARRAAGGGLRRSLAARCARWAARWPAGAALRLRPSAPLSLPSGGVPLPAVALPLGRSSPPRPCGAPGGPGVFLFRRFPRPAVAPVCAAFRAAWACACAAPRRAAAVGLGGFSPPPAWALVFLNKGDVAFHASPGSAVRPGRDGSQPPNSLVPCPSSFATENPGLTISPFYCTIIHG